MLESITIAAITAFFVLGFSHWASRELFGELGKLWCYIAGTVLISAVYLAWCLWQREPLPAWLAFVAYAAIVAGAGAGTLSSHLIDNHKGLQREVYAHRRRLDDAE